MGRIVLLTLALAVAACAAPPGKPGVAVSAANKTIHGYHPRSTLATAQSTVDTALYPATDIHCHWDLDDDPRAMLAAMDARNVHCAINLSGGWGNGLTTMLDRFHAIAADRFLIFYNIDFSRIDEPGFGQAIATEIEDAASRGVRGLKIFKDLGLRIRDGSGALVPVDDARLDPIWAKCGELGLPVLIHTADPVAFFDPIDEHNERWMQLQRHPSWSFYGAEFPSRDEVLGQRDRMMARHPGTNFIGAHLGSQAEDLAGLARRLDAHSNFFVDISGRVAELGRQPYTARRFFLAYPDRILFGTDRFPGRSDQPRYRIYFRFLETDDESFDYYEHPFPPTGEWKINGIFLPDDVLEKIYRDNASHLLLRPS